MAKGEPYNFTTRTNSTIRFRYFFAFDIIIQCPASYASLRRERYLDIARSADAASEAMWNPPWFPQPTAGQSPADSPDRHAPFQRAPPSEPDHWLQDTSVKLPVNAPWPDGKKAFDPPVSSQMSKLWAMSLCFIQAVENANRLLEGLAE